MTEAEKQALINQFNELAMLQRLAGESLQKLARAIEALQIKPAKEA